MSRIVSSAFLALALLCSGWLFFAGPAGATPQFASQTGKECAFCHVTPGGPLTEAGTSFRDNGSVLPTATSTGAPTPTHAGPATTPAGPVTAVGPILVLPVWLRTLLLWAHLVGVVAWLGAIIFVHLVQTPKVAGQGIPRGYLKLAWPSITMLGLSGVILTLTDITGFGMLTEGRWGRLLLTKIGIYVILACIAFFATLVMSPRLRRMNDRQQVGHHRGQEQFRAEGRVTFSHAGCTYDVTGSRLWREGRHAKRHDAWQDLTASLAGAPHGIEVFERFPMVAGSEEAKAPVLMRLFVAVAYFNLFLVLAALFVVAAW